MDTNFLSQLKDSLLQRKQNILDYIRGATPASVRMRTGPPGDEAVEDHLRALDAALRKADDNTLGLCEVCHEFVEDTRLEMDYTACVCLEHLSGEERTRLENDLELSQKVQQALLPHTMPVIGGVDMAAFSQPAHIVGGDYFDFLKFGDGAQALVIADVMGKGMAASMLMSNLQASLRIIIGENTEPRNVVNRLNHLFSNNIRLTKFVTLFLARFDENTRKLTYCNAGHNPPLILRNDGSVEQLKPTGAAIGLIDQFEFEQHEVVLHPGERVLLYTDGVVEAPNEKKELFGDERLKDFLRISKHLSASKMMATLRESLQSFTGTKNQSDDTTIIVLDILTQK